jgi:thiol-disulfide isomerase/thioredoxin
MEVVKIKSDEEFKDIIMKEKSIVMIHKTGCNYCEKAKPWLIEFAEKFPKKVISEVNRDDIPKVMDNFQVEMYPTFVSSSKGKVVEMEYGNTEYDNISKFIEKN